MAMALKRMSPKRASSAAQEILPIVAKPDDFKCMEAFSDLGSASATWIDAICDWHCGWLEKVWGKRAPTRPSGRCLCRTERFYRPAGIGAPEVRMRKSRPYRLYRSLSRPRRNALRHTRTVLNVRSSPPCTDTIIAANIRRVVIGVVDANPNHQGRGLEQLRRAGISVTTGVLEEECRLLNVGFSKWVTTREALGDRQSCPIPGRPDYTPFGRTPWLSNNRSLRLVHCLRATVDAILVGAETIRRDNPKLTVRMGTPSLRPWRVVVTRSGDLPSDATVLTDEYRDRTLVYQGSTGWIC